MRTRSGQIAASKINAYRDRFVTHVHLLLWMGYSRLDRSKLPDLDEPEISGLICKNIDAVLDDTASDDWVYDYEIYDDPPVHDGGRLGKHRRRVDIKLQSHRVRPRLRFCFEAKALRAGRSLSEYFGEDGLGRFLDGSYSSDQTMSGMIAYVQTDGCDEWCAKLASRLDKDVHRIGRSGTWMPVRIADELPHTYRTRHKRVKRLPNITIIHTLLDCTGDVARSLRDRECG